MIYGYLFVVLLALADPHTQIMEPAPSFRIFLPRNGETLNSLYVGRHEGGVVVALDYDRYPSRDPVPMLLLNGPDHMEITQASLPEETASGREEGMR